MIVALLVALSYAPTGPADAIQHPRLILTRPRIAGLKSSLATTRASLWGPVLESANQFSRAAIPRMSDAGNRFRYIGDTMPVLGLAYWMTGDAAYVAAADRWLRALLEVEKWSGSANLGRSSWLLGSALLYDWLYDQLDAGTRAAVRKRLEAEGEILARDDGNYWRLLSNHCLIETSALGAAGLALGDGEPAVRFVRKARERTELIIEHAPLDGAWSEGVQYWEYGLSYFLRYLEALRTSGTADYFAGYEWLKKTGYFPIYFSLPGLHGFVNFSDCCSARMADRWQASFLSYLIAARYRNGHFQDLANRTLSSQPYKFSWMDFISYDPNVAAVDFHELPPGKHFDDSGFVIMRSSWRDDATVIGFRCGPAPGHRNQRDPRRLERKGFGPGHQHPDINSFSLYSHGRWLAIDPGYVHLKMTADHNTVLVNGRGQTGEGKVWLDHMAFQLREPAPAILRAESHPDYDYTIGDAGGIYVDEARLASFRRHLLFLKPAILVVADDLVAKTPSRFEWLLHALHSVGRTGPNRFEIREGDVRLSVAPVLPSAYTPSIAERDYDASNVDGKLVTLNLRADSVSRVRFLVVLAVLKDPSSRPPDVEYSQGALVIRHLDRSWRVRVADPASLTAPADSVLTVEPAGT
jgi:hypothetical protein